MAVPAGAEAHQQGDKAEEPGDRPGDHAECQRQQEGDRDAQEAHKEAQQGMAGSAVDVNDAHDGLSSK